MNLKELFKKWRFWLTIAVVTLLILSFLPIWGMGCNEVGDRIICATPQNFWQSLASGPQTPAPETDAYFCNIDSDCVVKDVRNCCGSFLRCVNKDYIPDIEALKRKCQEEGRDDVCGYPEITHCKCIENTCKSMQGDSIV